MFALQKTIGSARLASQIVQRRTIVCTPPTVKVSFLEKLVGGLTIAGSMLAVPTYIILNLKNYRQET